MSSIQSDRDYIEILKKEITDLKIHNDREKQDLELSHKNEIQQLEERHQAEKEELHRKLKEEQVCFKLDILAFSLGGKIFQSTRIELLYSTFMPRK